MSGTPSASSSTTPPEPCSPCSAPTAPYSSETPGTLGGNSRLRIYGRLDCWSANRWVGKGYENIRVFFADDATAIAAGYRPCGNCMRTEYCVEGRSAPEDVN